MRRRVAVALVGALVTTACGSQPAYVAHGRQGSWERVARTTFDAGASFAIEGLGAPGDGYPRWTAVGGILDAAGRDSAVAWSSADGTRWMRSELDAGDAHAARAAAVAIGQGRAVAVGTVVTPAGDRDGRVWTSTDGAAWTPVQLAVGVAGGPGDQSITSVAAGPLGFVAAGVDVRRGRSVPALWWSSDGMAWTRVPDEKSVFRDEHTISGVAVGRSGIVAVGTADLSGDIDGMAWFSADGTNWRTAPLAAAGFTGRAAQTVQAVTAGPGGFVAVGDDANGDRRIGVVWTSADGINWERTTEMTQSGSTAGLSLRAVAGSGSVVAVGDNGFSLSMYRSTDGKRWTTDDAPTVPDRTLLDGAKAMVAANGTAVLVGFTAGHLWFRSPGAGWVEVGGDAAVFPAPARRRTLRTMVHGPTGFVAVEPGGRDNVWRSADGVAWEETHEPFGTGSVEALAVFGDAVVAVGTIRDPDPVAAVWISSDGGATWERVGAGNPAFSTREVTQMFGVTLGGPGLVAVGLGFDGETIDAEAWSSSDGRAWRRASEPLAWSGSGDQMLSHACRLPDGGVVAVGPINTGGDQDVWAWTSRDGINWARATGLDAALLGGPGPQGATSCASTSRGVLVTAEVPGPGGSDGVLWGSEDGKRWHTVGGSDVFGGPSNDFLRAIGVDGSRLVVTGVEDGGVVILTSADDGTTWRKRATSTLAAFHGQMATAAAIVGDLVVMAGSDGPSAAVWVGPAP